MATVGLQTFDTSGNLIIDTTTRLTKFLGKVTVSNGADGSLSISIPTNAEPFAFVIPRGAPWVTRNMTEITITRSLLTWKYYKNSVPTAQQSSYTTITCDIYYGYY